MKHKIDPFGLIFWGGETNVLETPWPMALSSMLQSFSIWVLRYENCSSSNLPIFTWRWVAKHASVSFWRRVQYHYNWHHLGYHYSRHPDITTVGIQYLKVQLIFTTTSWTRNVNCVTSCAPSLAQFLSLCVIWKDLHGFPTTNIPTWHRAVMASQHQWRIPSPWTLKRCRFLQASAWNYFGHAIDIACD